MKNSHTQSVLVKDTTKQELLGNAIGALIAVNRPALIELLQKFSNDYNEDLSNEDLSKLIINKIALSKSFTSKIIELMKLNTDIVPTRLNSKVNFWGGDNDGFGGGSGSIIDAALKGLGMVTSTWQSTANTNANATIQAATLNANALMFNTTKETEKKLNQTQIFSLIFGGIILIAISVLIIIKSSK